MPTTTHLRNIWGPSHTTLCGEYVSPDAATLVPEQVTCDKCLALMGRAPHQSTGTGDPRR
jgi:hypothetical protein